MKTFIVYTAITKGYDKLKPPPGQWENEADFIAFLDHPQPDTGWDTRPLHQEFLDPCRNAKIHKILPHVYFPKAQYSLWIDGSVEVKSTWPLHQWIEEYLREHDLAVFKHRYHDCIFQEGRICLQLELDDPAAINRQMKRYFTERYPFHNGLAECTILLRRHSPAIVRFNEAWHEEIMNGSRRDQLSFNYVVHKLGVKYFSLPGTISENPHFSLQPHVKKRRKFSAVAQR